MTPLASPPKVAPLPETLDVGYQHEGTPLEAIAENSANGYFFFIAWAALFLSLRYAGEVRALERRSAELRAAAQSAELRALRYQVNPHFLFNTLNSLSSLILTDKAEQAERMVLNLSTFFRTSLSGDPTEDVSLAEEIALQRLYLDIEAVRFPDRLRIETDALATRHVEPREPRQRGGLAGAEEAAHHNETQVVHAGHLRGRKHPAIL